MQTKRYTVMAKRAAGHRHRLEPVELVAQLLPLLPGEEFRKSHPLAQRDVHGEKPTMPPPGRHLRAVAW